MPEKSWTELGCKTWLLCNHNFSVANKHVLVYTKVTRILEPTFLIGA